MPKNLRIELSVPLDEEAFEEHDGDEMAPPNEIEEWEAQDVFRAADLALIEVRDAELVSEIEIEEGED